MFVLCDTVTPTEYIASSITQPHGRLGSLPIILSLHLPPPPHLSHQTLRLLHLITHPYTTPPPTSRSSPDRPRRSTHTSLAITSLLTRSSSRSRSQIHHHASSSSSVSDGSSGLDGGLGEERISVSPSPRIISWLGSHLHPRYSQQRGVHQRVLLLSSASATRFASCVFAFPRTSLFSGGNGCPTKHRFLARYRGPCISPFRLQSPIRS